MFTEEGRFRGVQISRIKESLGDLSLEELDMIVDIVELFVDSKKQKNE